MERFLESLGLSGEQAGELGEQVRASGRLTFQPPGLPQVRLLEAGSDLALLAREEGGPAWAALTTRWRTEFHLSHLARMPGGNLIGTGQWEPVTGEPLPVSLHINQLSVTEGLREEPRTYAAYLALLGEKAVVRPGGPARLQSFPGPTATPAEQCRLRVVGRVSHAYPVENELSGRQVLQVWLTAPGSWAILSALPMGAVREKPEPGSWLEVEGMLQGELVGSDRL